ncbi:NAD(P)/FAD-dependent oxidoreductase [Pseudosporangium ferrugineum]|uniref:Lysine/ornithine N-monooxygenase n=1 Tax=Pseudosporangium ferrugineum TaxID=439699 RepID=A0A2T0SAR2_9ACTN|nr:NAD(P)/FAD-dependent oxidoreductase [Pseudosporangium ferrugineum]PRY30506.1 lysine/ornithine N-monooxygenase [Pseudosporangium ferrugineum]
MNPLVQVIGFGPAALGLPLSADRTGDLAALADAGVAFLERAPADTARAGRMPYLIDSNSPAADFLAGIDPGGRFGAVLRRRPARALAERGRSPVPLRLVAGLLGDIADAVAAWLAGTGGELTYGRDVREIRHGPGGTFTSVGADGRELVSRAVVFATGGGEQDPRPAGPPPGAVPARVMTSQEVLSGSIQPAVAALRAGLPVVIVGGSHSGFSVADLLLRSCGTKLTPGQITILYRRLDLCFDSMSELDASGWRPGYAPAVCPDTGMVNRHRGLRGRSRDLCLAVLKGRERRVRLCRAEAEAYGRGAGVVVTATGYRATAPPLIGPDGRRVPLRMSAGRYELDPRGRLLGPDGAVPGLFGIGLGYGRRDAHGDYDVGLNFFHGRHAEEIVDGLLRPEPARPR